MEKLFITDLDGTFLGSDRVITKFANQALKNYDNVGIATGRNIFSVYKIIKDSHFNKNIILCNGACIYDMESDSFSNIIAINPRLYDRISALITQVSTKPIIIGFKGERPYYQYMHNHNRQYDKFLNYAKFYDSALETKVNSFDFENQVIEIIYYDSKENILRIKNQFESNFPNQFMYECRYSVMIDDKRLWFLAIFDATVGKGQAVERIACEQQVNSSEVYVFGDGENDVDMFIKPFRKIAVHNAVREILELADVIIGKNTDDSVIKYIIKKNG